MKPTRGRSLVNQVIIYCIALSCLACQTGEAQATPGKGWLGIGIDEMTPSMRDEYGIGDRSGLLVTWVQRDSPADEAGLREHDVIIKFSGKNVNRTEDFVELVQATAPKSQVKLEIVRKGKDRTIDVEVGKKRRNRVAVISGEGHGAIAFFGRGQLGVQVHELNDDLKSYFTGAGNGGVLILSVSAGSPAAKAALKPGDVIVSLDDQAVEDHEDLLDILEDFDDGDDIKVGYVRHGKRADVTVELENQFEFDSNRFHVAPHIWNGESRHRRLRKMEDRERDAKIHLERIIGGSTEI